VSPHTRLIPPGLLTAALLLGLIAACGEPPQPMPTSPPYATTSVGPVGSGIPSRAALPTVTAYPTLPGVTAYPTAYGYPTAYPTLPGVVPTTTDPNVKPPSPTPSHARKCTGPPTGSEILTLIKGKPGVPDKKFGVADGPYCGGDWSFTVVEEQGQSEDQAEPLMVVATGKGTTLTLVAAGQEVCLNSVQKNAPSSIRVLACGF
jgi:hypothetical protein